MDGKAGGASETLFEISSIAFISVAASMILLNI